MNKPEEIVTKDLSRFGFREHEEAKRLLSVYSTDKDKSNLSTGVEVWFNTHSGFVFLTDSDYATAMINDKGHLVDFITCPECGEEGLITNFKEIAENDCCKKFYKEIIAS